MEEKRENEEQYTICNEGIILPSTAENEWSISPKIDAEKELKKMRDRKRIKNIRVIRREYLNYQLIIMEIRERN